MATTYERKKARQSNIIYTFITAILIIAIFSVMITSFYFEAESEAYDMLHIQTRQIKDDITLQMKSDKENLITMANFASKLYADGKGYERMFDSFKPIGLFSRIGILTPDGVFTTKDEAVDISDKLSFSEEAAKGEYVTGRVYSYSRPDEQVVRCMVPIISGGVTVAMMYGIINIETINERYNERAKALNAQLFVYDKETGKFIIDTIDKNPGELSQLKDRKYNGGYSYEALANSDKGFSSFKSKFTGEDLYIHYSTMEDFNWGIILARHENQVFAETHKIAINMFLALFDVILVIVVYLRLILKSEKSRTRLNAESSAIRKLLLEINENESNITEAMRRIKEFSVARSAFFADTDGEEFFCIKPTFEHDLIRGVDKSYFHREIFNYALKIHNAGKSPTGFMQILPDKHLEKTNENLYKFLKEHGIKDVSVAIVVGKDNHLSILGTMNPRKSAVARKLLEDIAICFSIAVYNKKHLNRTELAATTDSLTGALNRVAYKKDLLVFDEEKPKDFSCIYIDVNELHIRNNKYGHAAGDEMLIYIANTLKDIFCGHRIYRMGGDEFLVFAKSVGYDDIKQNIDRFIEQLKTTDYTVAIGMSYRTQNTNCEEMVREAEVRMYEAKSQYYQDKDRASLAQDQDDNYVISKTGIKEVDAMISVFQEHYNGIYRVSLDTDVAHRILMPSYLGYLENESNFSRLVTKYMEDYIAPDFHRAVLSFLNYDAIKRQISEGKRPSITYKKLNGETVTLSVYNLNDTPDDVKETLWVFAKD